MLRRSISATDAAPTPDGHGPPADLRGQALALGGGERLGVADAGDAVAVRAG